jgi:SAM-dependent methyltransferase
VYYILQVSQQIGYNKDMDKTIAYFNEHAEKQFREAFEIKDRTQQDLFLSHVRKGGHVLDLGCGSGRDTAYFKEQGYTADACDGSEELCRLASEYLKQPVKVMDFRELCADSAYDGIYASASVMHLPYEDLRNLFPKLFWALKEDGVLYASFKYGDHEEFSHGRHFTYLNEDRIRELVKDLPCEMIEIGRFGLDMEKLYGFSWIYILAKKNIK